MPYNNSFALDSLPVSDSLTIHFAKLVFDLHALQSELAITPDEQLFHVKRKQFELEFRFGQFISKDTPSTNSSVTCSDCREHMALGTCGFLVFKDDSNHAPIYRLKNGVRDTTISALRSSLNRAVEFSGSCPNAPVQVKFSRTKSTDIPIIVNGERARLEISRDVTTGQEISKSITMKKDVPSVPRGYVSDCSLEGGEKGGLDRGSGRIAVKIECEIDPKISFVEVSDEEPRQKSRASYVLNDVAEIALTKVRSGIETSNEVEIELTQNALSRAFGLIDQIYALFDETDAVIDAELALSQASKGQRGERNSELKETLKGKKEYFLQLRQAYMDYYELVSQFSSAIMSISAHMKDGFEPLMQVVDNGDVLLAHARRVKN